MATIILDVVYVQYRNTDLFYFVNEKLRNRYFRFFVGFSMFLLIRNYGSQRRSPDARAVKRGQNCIRAFISYVVYAKYSDTDPFNFFNDVSRAGKNCQLRNSGFSIFCRLFNVSVDS